MLVHLASRGCERRGLGRRRGVLGTYACNVLELAAPGRLVFVVDPICIVFDVGGQLLYQVR